MLETMRSVEALVIIRAKPIEVINAFVDHEHLKAWWGVERSLVEARPGGVWALAWEISEAGMKYVSSGTLHDYEAGEYLRIDNLVYLNPERQILGPLTLEIFADEIRDGTKVRVIQSGYQSGNDWDWYYDAVVQAWPYALELLKKYLESGIRIEQSN
jgi:uncharacterized protein YndB with AHSA1/START domain